MQFERRKEFLFILQYFIHLFIFLSSFKYIFFFNHLQFTFAWSRMLIKFPIKILFYYFLFFSFIIFFFFLSSFKERKTKTKKNWISLKIWQYPGAPRASVAFPVDVCICIYMWECREWTWIVLKPEIASPVSLSLCICADLSKHQCYCIWASIYILSCLYFLFFFSSLFFVSPHRLFFLIHPRVTRSLEFNENGFFFSLIYIENKIKNENKI